MVLVKIKLLIFFLNIVIVVIDDLLKYYFVFILNWLVVSGFSCGLLVELELVLGVKFIVGVNWNGVGCVSMCVVVICSNIFLDKLYDKLMFGSYLL